MTSAARFLQLLLLAVSMWAVIYARLTLGPLQEAIRIDLSLSDNQVAWLQGPAVVIPMALMSIPAGLIVDRYSSVRLVFFFVALSLVATVLTAVASSLPMLFAARCMAGLSLGAINVAAYALIANWYAPAQRGRATMVVFIGEVAGAPAAFALGGALLAMGGSTTNPEPWRWAVWWMCIPLALAVLLMMGLRKPPRRTPAHESPPLRAVWPELWRYRRVGVPLFFARIMVWMADAATVIWGTSIFARRFSLPPDRTGAIMATALLVSGVLGPALGGPIADFCHRHGGPRRVVTAMCGLALLGAPGALFPLMPDALTASIILTIFLTLGFASSTAAMTLSTIVIPLELRGLYLAITLTVGVILCGGVAPLLVSGLSGAIGGPSMIGTAAAVVCGITSLLGAVVYGFGRRYFASHNGA